MAQQNQTTVTLTPAQLALLKTEVQLTDYAGFTDQQTADALNAPHNVPNPNIPDRLSKAVILQKDVQNLLTPIVLGLMKSGDSKLPTYQYIQAQVNAHVGDYVPADVALYASEMIADGLLTQVQMLSMTTDLDPGYSPSLIQNPRAWYLFNAPIIIEESDVTTAKASS